MSAIIHPPQALAVLRLARHHPARHETIVLLLDGERRGLGLIVVAGTDHPDAVITVVDRVCDPAVHDGRVSSVVVASVRPADVHDPERWMELAWSAEQHGVELLEWFVDDAVVSCPRDSLGAPRRW
jgi:hypothetical protein